MSCRSPPVAFVFKQEASKLRLGGCKYSETDDQLNFMKLSPFGTWTLDLTQATAPIDWAAITSIRVRLVGKHQSLKGDKFSMILMRCQVRVHP